MSEGKSKQEIREQLEEHLNSPLPILLRLRNLVFGEQAPDTYTKISFFFALIIWCIFFLWSILGLVVIQSRHWIKEEKKIDVTQLIEQRGQELGFDRFVFADRLETFHTASIVCWIIVFAGLVLLYRKRMEFIYLFGAGTGIYLLLMWFMLGFGYWLKDTTTFDKIVFILMVAHTFLYYYFLKMEKAGNKTNFFGIKEEDND